MEYILLKAFGVLIGAAILVILGMKYGILYDGRYDDEIMYDEPTSTEPKVRLHYSYDVGSSIVICPVSKIMYYTKRFTVLSIEPYKE